MSECRPNCSAGDGVDDESAAGDTSGEAANIYGGRGGSCSSGIIKSLDELILDQKQVVERAAGSEPQDAIAREELSRQHACVKCSERSRCYPTDAGYAYVADRLVALSGTCAPVVFTPHGQWRFDEACRVVGGTVTSRMSENASEHGQRVRNLVCESGRVNGNRRPSPVVARRKRRDVSYWKSPGSNSVLSKAS